jgi:hypothetical protein
MLLRIKLLAALLVVSVCSLIVLPTAAQSNDHLDSNSPAKAVALASPAHIVAITPEPTSTVKTPKPAAKPVVPPVTYSVDWSSTTPALSQGGLLGGLACAPTALAMITAHYHMLNPGAGSRTPEEFVANLQPGDFVAGEGVSYPRLATQLPALGYTNITGHMSTSQAELAQALQTGPIIVTAGADTLGRVGSHSLVATALSDNFAYIRMNDPATGRNVTLSWSAFDRIWAGGNRGILYVRP